MIEYIVESTICFAFLYLGYLIVCNNSRRYKTNRILLICFVLFSTVVPLINILIVPSQLNVLNQNSITPATLTVSSYIPESLLAANSSIGNNKDYTFWLVAIYLSIALLLLVKFIFNFCVLLLKSKNSEKIKSHGTRLNLIDDMRNPFTFFTSIFINKKQYEQGKIDEELIIHEIAHQKQLHSIDIVIIEIIHLLIWFNPIILLFKRLIKANHEYLADEFVLNSGTCPSNYANKLLHHSFQKKLAGLTSGFNHLLIKNRLIMLSKHGTMKKNASQMIILIPLVAILFIGTAFTLPNNTNNNHKSENLGKGAVKPGIFYADTLYWSGENRRVYMKGEVKVKYGKNDFKGNGVFSVLGAVQLLIIDGQAATLNSSLIVSGIKCQVYKLPEEEAIKKYGPKGEQGVVEINRIR